jgi:hypothetical protein
MRLMVQLLLQLCSSQLLTHFVMKRCTGCLLFSKDALWGVVQRGCSPFCIAVFVTVLYTTLVSVVGPLSNTVTAAAVALF